MKKLFFYTIILPSLFSLSHKPLDAMFKSKKEKHSSSCPPTFAGPSILTLPTPKNSTESISAGRKMFFRKKQERKSSSLDRTSNPKEEKFALNSAIIDLSHMNLGAYSTEKIQSLFTEEFEDRLSLKNFSEIIESIILDNNNFGNCLSKTINNLILIAEKLPYFTNLKYISLQFNRLENLPLDNTLQGMTPHRNGLTALCTKLNQSENLNVVDFSNNFFRDDQKKLIREILKGAINIIF